ncbi:TRAP transporter substrate-binding protein [Rhizobium sp. SL86]|uniref:TRAP transporter substrate-binding protein n=1 Tax=Rhizobium sp. SL86 TaxID=2995148 RepID=UPI0022743FC9|nr:TRAP transporter substrate-binding protein [Rhizobium sp. SL86]MCY1666536.1 TRAP transporter substrate-binding protein [Rhizobium sp. SL86]
MKNMFSAGLLAGMMLAVGMSPALAQTTLKVSSYLPPNHTWQKALVQWGEELKAKTGGEVSLEIYPAAQLGPVNRQFDLVKTGVADVAVILHSATPGRFPVTELAGLPLSYPSAGQTSEITSRRLTELAPQYLAAEHAGTKILWMAVTPPLKLHTTSVAVTSIDKVKGLRVRYAGKVFQQMLEAFGAAPLPVSPGETADSLSKGIIDATTFPYEATKSFNLGPIVKHSMEPGLASNSFALVMNQSVFDGLSEKSRKVIEETTGPQRAGDFGKMWDAGEAEGRAYMIENKVSIETLSDTELARFKKALEPVNAAAIAQIDQSGKPGSAFVAAYTK